MQLRFPSPNTVAQKLLITQTWSQLKIKVCNLIKRVKNMFWALTDQFAIVESKLELTFEWWANFGSLYFGLLFCSSHFWFLVTFGDEVTKILRNLCLHFARKDGQDQKKTRKEKVTKIPKTKRQKYRMNKTYDYERKN